MNEIGSENGERESRDIRTTLAIIRTIEAEKRTHLAEMRTGMGILTVPLSLLTILIATSEYYDPFSVLPYIVGLVIGIGALSLIGTYLVVRSLRKIRANEKLREETCTDTASLVRQHNGTKNCST